jgi:hypothetical protein
VRVTVTRAEHKDGKHDPKAKEGFRFEFRDAPGMKGGWMWGREKPAPKAEAPKTPETPKAPARGQSDKRVEDVEKKLDALIREIEALKKEIKGGEQKDKERPRGRGGFGPPKQ